jgi:hypothetical protein
LDKDPQADDALAGAFAGTRQEGNAGSKYFQFDEKDEGWNLFVVDLVADGHGLGKGIHGEFDTLYQTSDLYAGDLIGTIFSD